ncbi:MAG: response regulator [Nitrospira sp.]|nr:response regulator [Nitrospira sp.]
MTFTHRQTWGERWHHPTMTAVLDTLPFGVVLATNDGSIIWSNLEGARLLGRPQASLAGRSFPDLWATLTDSDAALMRERLKSVATSREPTPAAKVRLRIGVATGIPVEWTCHVFDWPDQSLPPGLTISLRDLSREEELEFERDRLAAIAEEAPLPIVELDREGNMLYANPAMTTWLAALGYRDDGTPCVLPEQLPQKVSQCLGGGEPLQGLDVSLPEAAFTWTLCPVKTHGLVRGYGIDVTKIRKAQQELIRAAQELKDANRRLDEALTVAQEAAKAKATFLAMMSHEIRTPMNGVIGMTSLLMETPLTPEQKTYVTTVRQCGESLLRVINDVLEYSKIEAGKLELESLDFDLRSAVEDALAQFAQQAAAKGVELTGLVHANVPIALRGDPARLRQILTNLVGNAVKFTHQGEVSLQVYLEEDSPDEAVIRFDVTDTGIGISPETLAKLFNPFVQGDSSTTRQYGGTGLGLMISKQLIELMGGHISVFSTVGQGSTFRFTTRFAKQTNSSPAILPSEDLAGHRVLIVDSHRWGRHVLHQLTTGWGMIAEVAENADIAMRRFAEAAQRGDSFDLVIVDVAMPGKDGLQLVRELRQLPTARMTQVVLLFPLLQRDITRHTQQVGAADYLQKPIRHNQLQDCVRRALAPARETMPPGQPLPEEHRPQERQAAPALLRPRILIVEDNEINQKLARRMVEKLGYDTCVAHNGQEALDALAHADYDAILMDCQMPVLDGLETTRLIRQREAAPPLANGTGGESETQTIRARQRTGHIPIIAVTANAMKGDREQCLAAGMDDYLAKPIQLETLRSVLHRWVPPPPPFPARVGERAMGGHLDADVVDLAALQTNLGNDQSLIRQLVGLFVDHHQARLTEIKEGLAAGDAETVERAAHTLKGAAGNLCARQAMSAASRIEEMARQGRIEDAKAFYSELESAVLRLVRVLEQHHTETTSFPQAA